MLTGGQNGQRLFFLGRFYQSKDKELQNPAVCIELGVMETSERGIARYL